MVGSAIMRHLLEQGVPADAIVTRTRSELSLYERPEDGAAAVEVEE